MSARKQASTSVYEWSEIAGQDDSSSSRRPMRSSSNPPSTPNCTSRRCVPPCDLASRGAHEELAAKIAREAREWSSTFRREVMVAYLFGCVRALFLLWLWWNVVAVSIPIQSFLGVVKTNYVFQVVPRVCEGGERGSK
ncbi:hypothetical protein K503DRAFT_111911 [Rhizopogon vinicolor AM-OR11-026]|uniref:Uncharacterized protein n=1 Tax=Rhizopogon vinicolor AM-OR11-026 TaxID=1314800 RepID=A0A1B7MEZ7_9AGAM|nr:hypothetical protein K503DRAFT_111911 [Rhizopogon vinicolor AM-OR11-026]